MPHALPVVGAQVTLGPIVRELGNSESILEG